MRQNLKQHSYKTNQRYSRQTVLPFIKLKGQNKISNSVVLIIGCGALGSVQAELIVRAGIGKIIIVDRDIVELHNLQRQCLFDEHDAFSRIPKAVAAAKHLKKINSTIDIMPVVADVTSANIDNLVSGVDIVLDGTDNFETRYLINDVCVREGIPWVYGGVLGAEGTIMPIRPAVGPCLSCVFPKIPNNKDSCELQGVLNTAVAWVASMQVSEVLKVIVDDEFSELSVRSMNVWDGAYSKILIKKKDDCPTCVKKQFKYLYGFYDRNANVLCSRNAVQITPESSLKIDFKDLADVLKDAGTVCLRGMFLEFEIDVYRLLIFPDGRIMVMGTTDVAIASGLASKYIGRFL